MRHLLRSLVLAVVLVPALSLVPSAKAASGPDRELCADPPGGTCRESLESCVSFRDCPIAGEACDCN
jgi:hypothetical protein